MLDGSAAHHALRELDALRGALDGGHYAEAALRLELLEREIAGRDATVVDIWRRLLGSERVRMEQLSGQVSGESRPA
jgi:hypothetical protein